MLIFHSYGSYVKLPEGSNFWTPTNPRDFEVCWAFASMDSAVSRRQFFATLADAAVPKLRDRFSPRHVAITCWALAKVGKSWFMMVYVGLCQPYGDGEREPRISQ